MCMNENLKNLHTEVKYPEPSTGSIPRRILIKSTRYVFAYDWYKSRSSILAEKTLPSANGSRNIK